MSPRVPLPVPGLGIVRRTLMLVGAALGAVIGLVTYAVAGLGPLDASIGGALLATLIGAVVLGLVLRSRPVMRMGGMALLALVRRVALGRLGRRAGRPLG
ncbi:MAG: hypothetical protein MUE51_01875 [Thermoleophilia bacterium]|nr:hypothetical protein [Thermoleophilia bacterium]